MSTYPDSTFAHIGLNVTDVKAVADWYKANLGLTAARWVGDSVVFLADPTGRVIIEFYTNPAEPVLDYKSTHFLTFHLAFLADDPDEISAKLQAVGATVAEEAKTTPAGDRMVMLRDPFGICIQFLRRSEPMF